MSNTKKLVSFDWAIKRLLRNKVSFTIFEGFLSELLRDDIKIKNLLESQYKTFCLDFLKHDPDVKLPRFVQFKRVSRLLPILKYDLEPFFTTVSSHFPLPSEGRENLHERHDANF